MMGYYHQNERDRAATLGCAGIIAIFLMCLLFVFVALVNIWLP